MLADLSINTVLYFIAEGTLKTDFLMKFSIDDLNSRGILINSSRDSVVEWRGNPKLFAPAWRVTLSGLLPDLCARKFLSHCATGKY